MALEFTPINSADELEEDSPLTFTPLAPEEITALKGRLGSLKQIKARQQDQAITGDRGIPDELWSKLMQAEGGAALTNDPMDRGGETKYGISKKANPDIDVANLTEEQARKIYEERYWNKLDPQDRTWDNFSRIVNQGPSAYKRTKGMSPEERQQADIDKYVGIVERSPDQEKFINGWMNRALDTDVFGDQKINLKGKSPEEIRAIVAAQSGRPQAPAAEEEFVPELTFSPVTMEEIGPDGLVAPGKPTSAETFILSAADSAAFGFGEEIVAAAKAGAGEIAELWNDAPEADKSSFLDRYVEYRDKGEEYMAKLREANPGAAILGDIAGGLAVPGMGMAKAAQAGLKQSMALGAGLGAVYGFGESREGLIGEADRYKLMKDTLAGAGFGAVGGAVGRGITKWLSGRPQVKGHVKMIEELDDSLHKDYVKTIRSNSKAWSQDAPKVAKAVDMDDVAGLPEHIQGERIEFMNWLYDNHANKVRRALTPDEQLGLRQQAERLTQDMLDAGYDYDGIMERTYAKLVKERTTPSIDEMYDAVREGVQKRGINLEDAYRVFKEEELFKNKYLESASLELSNKMGVKRNELKPAVFDKFTDLNVIAAQTDRLSPYTNFRSIVNEVASGHIAHQVDSAHFTGLLADAMKKSKGISKRQLADILETPATDVPEQYQAVKKVWSEFTDELYKYGRERGIFKEGQYLADYFPHMRIEPVEAVRKMRQTLSKGMDKVLNDDYTEFKDLRKIIRNELKVDGDLNKGHIQTFIQALDEPDFARKMAAKNEVGAAFSREGNIPELVREYDVGKAFGRYINQITRTPNMSTPLMKLKSEIGILQQMGLTRRAKYWNTYLDNMHGVKHSTANAIEDSINKFRLAVTRDADYLGEKLSLPRKVAYNAPDVMSWMGGVAYNNLLGFHPYAVVRNLGQPHFLTARELASGAGKGGSSYYHKMAGRAQFETLMDFMKAGGAKGRMYRAFDEMQNSMASQGKAPAEFVGEIEPMMREELNKVGGLTKEAVDRFGKVGLYFYGKSDMINRTVTDKMAKLTAKGAIAGEQRAINSIKKIGGRLGAEMEEALDAKNLDELHNLLAHHLIGTTQFHYGAHGAAEFVREWGRIVGMFTKWPIAVTSDIADMINRGEMRTLGAKYLSPVLTLMAGQQALNAVVDENDKYRRALLGRNLVDMAPLWSINVSTPPAISTVLSSIQAAKKLAKDPTKPEKTLKDMEQTLRPWLPVWGHVSTQIERYRGTK